MSSVPDSGGHDALNIPLSSIVIRARRTSVTLSGDADAEVVRPLALRVLRPAPDRDIPAYVYDPRRQIATDAEGEPWEPDMTKDWTTVEGTHTDGDGGDNELWGWEEVT
jgi:putative ATP-grasp target RiPP